MATHIVALLTLAAGCSEPSRRALRTERLVPIYNPPVDPTEVWLRFDIDTDNAVRYRDKIVFDPVVDDPSVLQRALVVLRQGGIDAGVIRLQTVMASDRIMVHVADAVRIDCHRWCEWAAVHNLMKACSQPEVGFWAVQLALMEVQD